MIRTAREIVDENFKGLDELIEDIDLLWFYRSLIRVCIEEYAEEIVEEIINRTYIADDNHNPIITKQDLINFKEELKTNNQ